MGRPPIPREKARSNRVVTFVTDQELADLTRGAEKADTSLSGFAHQLLLRGLKER